MHYGVVHYIFKYLQGNVHLGLCFCGGPYANIFQSYIDVDFASD
jgi:hypothetical protein